MSIDDRSGLDEVPGVHFPQPDAAPSRPREDPLGVTTRRAIENLVISPQDRPRFQNVSKLRDWVAERGGEDLRALVKALSRPHSANPLATEEIARVFTLAPDNRLQAVMRNLAFAVNETPVSGDDVLVSNYSSMEGVGISARPFANEGPDYQPLADYLEGRRKVLADENISQVFKPRRGEIQRAQLRIRAYIQLILGSCGVMPVISKGLGGIQEVGRDSATTFDPFTTDAGVSVMSPLIGRPTNPR